MAELPWMLATLVCLGGTAAADSGAAPAASESAAQAISVRSSYRGVSQDYLVMPRGGELSAQMRFLTADSMYGPRDQIKFTDLALFGLAGRWSLTSKLELGASVDLLPKQPTEADEKAWQSVGASLRSPLGRHAALHVAGGGGHLMSHSGKWTREALTLELQKPIEEHYLNFDVQASVSGLGLDAPTTKSRAFLTEVQVATTALFHDPHGYFGGWLGIAYAVPVTSSGRDPTTDVTIDPQARLSFHMGAVLSPVPKWDLFVDFGVIDRGDAADPSTRLPILDGGFDQTQIIFGMTRHIDAKQPAPNYDGDDDGVRLGSL